MNYKRIALLVISFLIFIFCVAHYITLRESSTGTTSSVNTKQMSVQPAGSIPPAIPSQEPLSAKTEVPSLEIMDGVPMGMHVALQKAEKVLLSSVERAQYQKALSNAALLSTAADIIVNSSAKEETRMKAVSFFDYALSWKENPARAMVLEQARRVLTDRSFESVQEISLKKSLAADRVELFALIYKHEPSQAEVIKKQFEGTPVGKLMTFGQNFYFSKLKGG